MDAACQLAAEDANGTTDPSSPSMALEPDLAETAASPRDPEPLLAPAGETHVFADARPNAKRPPRLSTTAPSIRIPGCLAEPEAAQPPLFQRHPLRPEQLRSLHWMTRQETNGHTCEFGTSVVRGGLLADRMGYGKTSTTIALISQGASELRAPGTGGLPRCTSQGQIPCDGTLVVCPPHLVNQWAEEFEKFLGSEAVEIVRTPEREVNAEGNFDMLLYEYLILDHTFFALSNVERKALTLANGELDKHAFLRLMQSRKPQFGIRCFERTRDVLGGREGIRILSIDNGHLIKVRAGDVITGLSFFGTEDSCSKNYISDSAGLSTGCILSNCACLLSLEAPEVVFSPRFSALITYRRPSAASQIAPPSTLGAWPLKILAIHDAKSLWRLKVQDFSKFHVVIMSAKIFLAQTYARAETFSGRADEKLRLLRQKILETSSPGQGWHRLLRHSPPLFEMMKWNRIVLDEFHESTQWDYKVRTKMQSLSTDHKWGLTGTPPFDSLERIAQTAALLGYATLPQSIKGGTLLKKFQAASVLGKAASDAYHTATRQAFLSDSENQQELQRAAQVFVEHFARQNTSDLLEAIRVVEHDEFVTLTNEERFIYRQACHDCNIYDLSQGYGAVSLSCREELLKRCAHFDLGEAQTARAAIQGIGQAKRERISLLEQQLAIEAARWHLLLPASCELQAACEPSHPRAQAAGAKATQRRDRPFKREELEVLLLFDVEEKTRKGAQEERVRRVVLRSQPVGISEYQPHLESRLAVIRALICAAELHKVVGWKECATALEILEKEECAIAIDLPRLLASGVEKLTTLLCEACRSYDFYKRQLQLLTAGAGQEECGVCLEAFDSLKMLAILPCAHLFHVSCAHRCLQQNPHCPECRRPACSLQVASVAVEIEATSVTVSAPTASSAVAHGSKLQAIAERLTRICENDVDAKIILFVQWKDLQNKICQALSTHGIRFACSSSPIVLKRFQEGASSERVLVLSLQHAASGANLTRANHIVFVHPMNAESAAEAAAYERQALARIRRIGQARSEVHLWRFIARDTVEEHLIKLHAGVGR